MQRGMTKFRNKSLQILNANLPRIKKHKDGEDRKRKLFVAGLKMKQILPTITYEHLLYNLIYEVYHYYDNRDKELNNDTVKRIAKGVLGIPIEEIKLESKCKKKYEVDKQYCAERGIKPNSYKNTVRKILKDEEIGNAQQPMTLLLLK